MSGSGGYYKYRCKYWLTYNCPHWVWVNNAPCAHCLADGRDSEVEMAAPFRISREVFVPQFENGMLLYTVMEIIAGSDWDSGWAVKETPAEPTFPSVTGPAAITITAMDGIDAQKSGKIGVQNPTAGRNWTGNEGHL